MQHVEWLKLHSWLVRLAYIKYWVSDLMLGQESGVVGAYTDIQAICCIGVKQQKTHTHNHLYIRMKNDWSVQGASVGAGTGVPIFRPRCWGEGGSLTYKIIRTRIDSPQNYEHTKNQDKILSNKNNIKYSNFYQNSIYIHDDNDYDPL